MTKPLARIALIAIVLTTTLISIHSKKKQAEAVSGALEALDFWSMQRAYPQSTIPEESFFKGYERSRLRFHKTADNNADEPWKLLGPYNQGGRTLALAVDPNNTDVVYAGSASGGLWKLTITNSSNYTWERINTGFPVLGVGAIAIDPRDSDVIYIGTGEVYAYQGSDGGLVNRLTRGSYGIGLLKTVDGGVTWEQSIDWSYAQKRGIQALKIDPVNPDRIFAGTTEGTYRSTDAGATWTLVNPVLMGVDIAINPQNPDIIFVSHGNFGSSDNGIYRSTDGGDTWTKLSGGLPSSWGGKTLMSIYEAAPNVIYADVADALNGIGLYRSLDSGDTWELINEEEYPSFQGWFAHYVRVSPIDSNRVFRAGVTYGISEDAGRRFLRFSGSTAQMHVDHHAFANHPTDPDVIFFANDGGVWRSTNGGYSIQGFNQGYVTTQFYNGFSSSSSDSNFAMGGLQDNSTTIYNGTDNWQTGVLGGDGAYTAINQNDNNTIYASSQRLNVFRSSNRGSSWTDINNSFSNRGSLAAFIAPYILVTHIEMFAATDRVYRSTNAGSSWSAGPVLNTNPIIALASTVADPTLVYAATVPAGNDRAELFKSEDRGATWSNVTRALPDRFIRDVFITRQNKNVAYVVLSGFGTSHVFRSENGGDTWEDIDRGNLPDVSTSAVFVDSRDYTNIYVGNDIGVWFSGDYGETWSEFKDGMPTAALVMDLSLSQSNWNLRAVTHGNGVFTRPLVEPDPPNGGGGQQLPEEFDLKQNFPNPFNPSTTINFSLPEDARVSVKIYNAMGQEIRNLVNQDYIAGEHTVLWDGRNNRGREAASGTYIYRFSAAGRTITKLMTLIR